MLYRCTMIIRCANRRLVAHAEYRLHRKWLHTRRPTSSAAFNYNSQHTTRCIIMIVCHIYTKSYICIVFLFLVRNGMVVQSFSIYPYPSSSLLHLYCSLSFMLFIHIFCDLPWFISLWYCNAALSLIAMTPNRSRSHRPLKKDKQPNSWHWAIYSFKFWPGSASLTPAWCEHRRGKSIVFTLWPWTLTCDFDLWTWHQQSPACHIATII